MLVQLLLEIGECTITTYSALKWTVTESIISMCEGCSDSLAFSTMIKLDVKFVSINADQCTDTEA